MVNPFFVSGLLRRFVRDQRGSASVESVLWFPAYMLLFVLIADVALVFHGQANAQRLVQDANRLASTGWWIDKSDDNDDETDIKLGLKAYVEDALTAANIAGGVATVTINNKVITTTLTIPASSLDAVGMFDVISGATVTVRTQHYREL